jgi:3-(3-hydroxy-phenyl)propionate hydroxylase
VFRDAALGLAETEPFARRLINSGRLSTATCYANSPLSGPDELEGEALEVRPGAAALDGPLEDGWLLDRTGGGFTGVWFSRDGHLPAGIAEGWSALAPFAPVVSQFIVSRETICARYGAEARPAFYLFRPDQHVAARWRSFSVAATQAAIERAMAGATPRATVQTKEPPWP